MTLVSAVLARERGHQLVARTTSTFITSEGSRVTDYHPRTGVTGIGEGAGYGEHSRKKERVVKGASR